jgi:hypothetical protein
MLPLHKLIVSTQSECVICVVEAKNNYKVFISGNVDDPDSEAKDNEVAERSNLALARGWVLPRGYN